MGGVKICGAWGGGSRRFNCGYCRTWSGVRYDLAEKYVWYETDLSSDYGRLISSKWIVERVHSRRSLEEQCEEGNCQLLTTSSSDV